MASAPGGPHRGPPVNLAADMNPMDRNIRRKRPEPCDRGAAV
jgi:hypothetical protein